MASKVWLSSPGVLPESVVEGVGGVIQSSFVVAVTVDLTTTDINDNGTTRAIKKAEVVLELNKIVQAIEKDLNSDFG